MRSSLLLSALCAAGALATPVDKREYVTDLTVITVTETITAQPTPAATTPAEQPVSTAPAEQAPAAQSTPENTPEDPPTPATTDQPPPVPTITPKSENNGQNNQDGQVVAWHTAWTTAWTSVWTGEAAAPTTLATQTQNPGAAPTNAYQDTIIYNHNVHRSNHSADSLSWSADLQASAHQLASQCVYEHNTNINGGGYGQNIGYGIDSNDIGKMITNLMYNDEFSYFEPYFGQANPDMGDFDLWGHFTQIVWKGTKQVGCATVVCDKLGNVDSSSSVPFTVCNYSPPGNYQGQYAANVKAPQGHQLLSL